MDRDRRRAWRCARSPPSTASAQSAPPTKEAGKLIVGFDLPAPGFWNGRASGTTIKNPHRLRVQPAREIAKTTGHLEGRVPARAVRRRSSRRLRRSTTSRSRRSTITAHGRRSSASRPRTSTRTRASSSPRASPKPKNVADLKKLQTCAQKDTTGLSYIQHKLRPAKKPLVYSASSTAAFDAVEARSLPGARSSTCRSSSRRARRRRARTAASSVRSSRASATAR